MKSLQVCKALKYQTWKMLHFWYDLNLNFHGSNFYVPWMHWKHSMKKKLVLDCIEAEAEHYGIRIHEVLPPDKLGRNSASAVWSSSLILVFYCTIVVYHHHIRSIMVVPVLKAAGWKRYQIILSISQQGSSIKKIK